MIVCTDTIHACKLMLVNDFRIAADGFREKSGTILHWSMVYQCTMFNTPLTLIHSAIYRHKAFEKIIRVCALNAMEKHRHGCGCSCVYSSGFFLIFAFYRKQEKMRIRTHSRLNNAKTKRIGYENIGKLYENEKRDTHSDPVKDQYNCNADNKTRTNTSIKFVWSGSRALPLHMSKDCVCWQLCFVWCFRGY